MTPRFLTELDTELRPDSDRIWLIKSPLIYISDIIGTIEVPAGFETDFASVPRLPLIYSLFGDRAHRESVLHDYLYRIDAAPQATFMQANSVFFEAMQVRKKASYIRYPMWWGVCLGGRSSYHKRRVGDHL